MTEHPERTLTVREECEGISNDARGQKIRLNRETLAAAAFVLDVGIRELEGLVQTLAHVIHLSAIEHGKAFPVHHHLDSVVLEDHVVGGGALGVVHHVSEAGTARLLHAQAQAHGTGLLVQVVLHALGGTGGEGDGHGVIIPRLAPKPPAGRLPAARPRRAWARAAPTLPPDRCRSSRPLLPGSVLRHVRSSPSTARWWRDSRTRGNAWLPRGRRPRASAPGGSPVRGAARRRCPVTRWPYPRGSSQRCAAHGSAPAPYPNIPLPARPWIQ